MNNPFDQLKKMAEVSLHEHASKREARQKAALPHLVEARRALREAAAQGYTTESFELLRRCLAQTIDDVETDLMRPPPTP